MYYLLPPTPLSTFFARFLIKLFILLETPLLISLTLAAAIGHQVLILTASLAERINASPTFSLNVSNAPATMCSLLREILCLKISASSKLLW
jgi:hypothetical protein